MFSGRRFTGVFIYWKGGTILSFEAVPKQQTLKQYVRRLWIRNRERIGEFYRIYFHTILVLILMVFNLFLGYSGFIIFLSHWHHSMGNPEFVLKLFMSQPPGWLISAMNAVYIPLDTYHWIWFFLALNLPVINWFYSTVTRAIKKGHRILLSWRHPKGRIVIFVLSAACFASLYIGIISWYVDVELFDTFKRIRMDEQFLIVRSMESFGYVLMAAPIFIVMFGAFIIIKQFYVFEDLREQFFSWEFPLFANQSFSLKNNRADVIVGWEKKTRKPIVLSEEQRYLHESVAGSTGTGKTSTTILIRIVQDLIRIARGKKMGIVVLEPKGDLIEDTLKIAKQLGIPDNKIKIVDPTNKMRSIKFNPFVGPMEAAAEAFRGTLDSLTTDQDDFFKGQQNETASAYTLLGKLRYHNLFNINHLQRMYTDPRYLADITEAVRKELDRKLSQPDLSKDDRNQLERYEKIVSYFEDEVLEYKTYRDRTTQEEKPLLYPENHKHAGKQVVINHKDKYITGAKKYLNDIAMNAMLSDLMTSDEGDNVLNLDAFLAEGGVILVNTALGELEELSLMLGQFFIRQLQSAIFRRPNNGQPFTYYRDGVKHQIDYERIPIFNYVDEFPLYANEAFERLLTLGRSYKVGTLIAFQDLAQLQRVERGYEKTVLSNTRNKTVFGGGEYSDAEYFSKLFGEEYRIEESLNESVTPVTTAENRWDFRYNTQRKLMPRFTPTEIMELKFKTFIIRRVDEDNNVTPPIEAVGKFVSETKFIKKFLKVGDLELVTEKMNPLDISSHLSKYKSLISEAITNDNHVDLGNSEEVKAKDKVEDKEHHFHSSSDSLKSASDIDEPLIDSHEEEPLEAEVVDLEVSVDDVEDVEPNFSKSINFAGENLSDDLSDLEFNIESLSLDDATDREPGYSTSKKTDSTNVISNGNESSQSISSGISNDVVDELVNEVYKRVEEKQNHPTLNQNNHDLSSPNIANEQPVQPNCSIEEKENKENDEWTINDIVDNESSKKNHRPSHVDVSIQDIQDISPDDF